MQMRKNFNLFKKAQKQDEKFRSQDAQNNTETKIRAFFSRAFFSDWNSNTEIVDVQIMSGIFHLIYKSFT